MVKVALFVRLEAKPAKHSNGLAQKPVRPLNLGVEQNL